MVQKLKVCQKECYLEFAVNVRYTAVIVTGAMARLAISTEKRFHDFRRKRRQEQLLSVKRPYVIRCIVEIQSLTAKTECLLTKLLQKVS